jgi:hypothetical protein
MATHCNEVKSVPKEGDEDSRTNLENDPIMTRLKDLEELTSLNTELSEPKIIFCNQLE